MLPDDLALKPKKSVREMIDRSTKIGTWCSLVQSGADWCSLVQLSVARRKFEFGPCRRRAM